MEYVFFKFFFFSEPWLVQTLDEGIILPDVHDIHEFMQRDVIKDEIYCVTVIKTWWKVNIHNLMETEKLNSIFV